MNKRSICATCLYPNNVCVCHAISPMTLPTNLLILQHPHETKQAKNTAKLIQLVSPECQIIVGETSEDFVDIRRAIEQQSHTPWVLYPNEASLPLESVAQQSSTERPQTLILIDATWRKAYKIWQSNPWLHTLPSWHFDQLPQGNYRVRKSKLPHSLSTLEAASHALTLLFGTDTQPMLNAFDAMQQHIEKHRTKPPST